MLYFLKEGSIRREIAFDFFANISFGIDGSYNFGLDLAIAISRSTDF